VSLAGEQPQAVKPADRHITGLFHQHTHGQAVDEAAGHLVPGLVLGEASAPQPGQDHRGRFPGPGGDIQQRRQRRMGLRGASLLGKGG
jgi:hypothetical protein